jgi:hypothetical protein
MMSRLTRRLVVAALVATLAAPVLVEAPASAGVLFTCPGIDSGFFLFSPGLSHTQTAQDAFYDTAHFGFDQACSNGEQALFRIGEIFTDYGLNAVTTYPTRPYGCLEMWGGAGPDYPDTTPILIGAADPSFNIHWSSTDTSSTGVTKVKQGPVANHWRLIFTITAGKYTAPAGMKTKIKFQAMIKAQKGNEPPATCADDSNPFGGVNLYPAGIVVVSQK